jgi:hypothetical protein
MAASWRPTLPKTVASHGNSWGNRHRSITRCVTVTLNDQVKTCKHWNLLPWRAKPPRAEYPNRYYGVIVNVSVPEDFRFSTEVAVMVTEFGVGGVGGAL